MLLDESPNLAELSRERSRELLWRYGVIASWYLYDYQIPVYQFLRSHRFPVFEATRRFGKTTTDLTVVNEDLMQNKEWVWRWCEPWKDQARKIVMPEMEIIFADCPHYLKPKFYRTDSFYEFPKTGSRLYLLGVNEDRGESARGSFSHGITIDEEGSLVEPEYIINEVLMPQLLTTSGSMRKMSTPPWELGHFWYTEKGRAIQDGRFLGRTIHAVNTISEEEKLRMCEAVGGPTSPAWRREFLCEPVSDPESLVIPEYDPSTVEVDDQYQRPNYNTRYVGIDLGFNDNTAAVFGYVDFEKQELVIEAEYVGAGRNSLEISESCKAIEQEIWGSLKPDVRVGDNDRQQLHDLQTLCDYFVVPTRKDDKVAAINALRLRFGAGKVKIKKRCKNLLYQLKVGLWNERRTDFLRGKTTGHLDAVDALIYLHRKIDWTRNPYPSNLGILSETHWINPAPPNSQSDHEALRNAFRPLARGPG